jgi:hypothetical protein
LIECIENCRDPSNNSDTPIQPTEMVYHIGVQLYHAGPKGLTELLPLRSLIEDGLVSIEDAQAAWMRKWGDWIEVDALLAHPTMDEISLTSDLSEARWIADAIDGSVYSVEVAEIHRVNEEGYPTVLGPVICEAA